MNFTKEQLTKAKSAKTAEELLALAKAEGISMTEAQAAKYFAELHKEGELNDSELASVAGGSKYDEEEPAKPTSYFYPLNFEKRVNISDKPCCPNDLGLSMCAECEGCDYPNNTKEYHICNGSHQRLTFPLQS